MTHETTRGPKGRATLFGAGAIALWSVLAVLTASAGELPPFEMTAITFGIGGLLLAVANALRGEGFAPYRQPWPVWAVGIGGLFGYHALYFTALTSAPPAEASLVCYLWPLLIVLGSALLPGERLRPNHVIGALLGLGGVAFLLGPKAQFSFDAMGGYLAALAAAVTWAAYSLASRRFAGVPSAIVAGYALGTAVLAAIAHFLFESWVPPAGFGAWAALAGLGLGPVGAAFLVWDIGMKRGDPRLLGALAYAAPLVSTLILVATGKAAASLGLGVACVAITAGAVLAGRKAPA
ncbi:DMT family transporter [Zavarzinia sp.]|uniref:aromatic amino acid exporter YddG n=1 Tax=Zavarzinia sp. TaxID=2027920 RepID=UPI003568BEE6